MDDALGERLARELASYRAAYEDPKLRAELVAAALPRIRATLDLLPPATATSRLLELGSSPFLTSVCLDLVWPGRVTHSNFFGTAERRGAQTLHEVGGAGTKTYEYDLFNVETDEFPYPGASFDVVIFSELIEHLAINPVWTLAEIHRVLKPDGHVIITTPNAVSVDRLTSLAHTFRQDVDRYSPVHGYGARHNGEWVPWELRLILGETGFEVETMIVRDLVPYPLGERLRRAALRLLLRPWSRESRRAHIFLRARRHAVFRWRFPPLLFTEARWYSAARDPVLEMGVNDAIQCGQGWEPIERLGDGTPVRRVRWTDAALPGATALLRGIAGASAVAIEARAERTGTGDLARGTVTVSGEHGEVIAWETVTVAPAAWTRALIPLERPAADREQVRVVITVERGHELAVQRIALTVPDGACTARA